MKRRDPILLAALALNALACIGEDAEPKFGFDERCFRDSDCESGVCGRTDPYVDLCTVKCDKPSEPCSEGDGYVCRETLTCGTPCEPGRTSGVCGADGVIRTCEEVDATACQICGCDLFGGGVCDPGKGCVEPAELGSACTNDSFCTSGTCDPETHTCIELRVRELGESCHHDFECKSENCSNDGKVDEAGKCNQKLGTACTQGSDTCTDCQGGIFDERCGRQNCDPETAPNCGEGWECAKAEQGYRCYESCESGEVHLCFDGFSTCQGGYCR